MYSKTFVLITLLDLSLAMPFCEFDKLQIIKNSLVKTLCSSHIASSFEENRIPQTIPSITCLDPASDFEVSISPAGFSCYQLQSKLQVTIWESKNGLKTFKNESMLVDIGCACAKRRMKDTESVRRPVFW